jgi:hypothetical protein
VFLSARWITFIVGLIISEIMKWAQHVARMGGGESCTQILVGKPEGKRPFGRPMFRWFFRKYGGRHGLD